MNGPLVFRRLVKSLVFGSIASPVAVTVCINAGPVQAEPACIKLSDVEIVRLLNSWRAAFASGNPVWLSALYANDATLTASKDGKPHKGTEAIRSYYKDLFAKHPMISIRPSSLASDCGTATVSGPVVYRLAGKRKGTRSLLAGTYTAEYALREGNWRIVRHLLAADPHVLPAHPQGATDASDGGDIR